MTPVSALRCILPFRQPTHSCLMREGRRDLNVLRSEDERGESEMAPDERILYNLLYER